jgi:hypothetical protein
MENDELSFFISEGIPIPVDGPCLGGCSSGTPREAQAHGGHLFGSCAEFVASECRPVHGGDSKGLRAESVKTARPARAGPKTNLINFSQGSTNRRKLSGQVGLFGFLPTKTRVAGLHTGVHKDNRRDADHKQAQQVEHTRF